jgi:DNA invertase Pin-like site-specific DNA recombinase
MLSYEPCNNARPMTTAVHPRVAAYIRVSTDSTDQENSYETQEKYFTRLLSENPSWTFVGIYSDYGVSGTSGEKRPGFRRLLHHCKEGKIDRIVCKSISRFARNTVDFITALKVLKEYKVTILFEKEALDTAIPINEFILTTMAAIAQEESRSISDNVRWGTRKHYARGEIANQALYGYGYTGRVLTTASGYRYKEIEIVETQAAVVRRIFNEAAVGKSYIGIARGLNGDNITPPESCHAKKRKTKAKPGQLNSDLEPGWTARQISEILKNERYMGDVLVQKTYTVDYLTHQVRENKGDMEQYLVRDHHPAIVSRELYSAAQRKNCSGKSKPRRKYAFSGKLICAECGRYYNLRNSQRNPIWVCPSAIQNNGKVICHAEKVREEQIRRMLKMEISERFGLTILPLPDNVDVPAILGGCFEAKQASTVSCILSAMESFQQTEYSESEYEQWEKTIEWLKTLPTGAEGTACLYNEMPDYFIRAITQSITIYSPLKFTVHWFDGTETEAEMHSNIES